MYIIKEIAQVWLIYLKLPFILYGGGTAALHKGTMTKEEAGTQENGTPPLPAKNPVQTKPVSKAV